MDKFERLLIDLNDTDRLVRLKAIEALRNLRDVRAVEPLINALQDAEICPFAVRTLKQIGTTEALEAVHQWQSDIVNSSQQLTQALIPALDFTLDELELNHNGQLSKHQRQQLRRMGGGAVTLMQIWLGGLVAGGGTITPYIFVNWSPILGGIFAVLLLILVTVLDGENCAF